MNRYNLFRTIFPSVLLLVCSVSCGRGGQDRTDGHAEENIADSTEVYGIQGFDAGNYTLREDKVRRGEFFADLLMKLGMDAQQAYNLSASCDTVFDVRTLRVGNGYKAYYTADTLEYLVYEKDRLRSVVFKCTEPYVIYNTEKPVSVERRYADVTIEHSLWEDMLEEGVIVKQDNGLYAITNLGAILLAKRLSDFSRISRKAIRVVQYQGNSRLNMLKEDVGGKGYVVGFEELIKYIEALLPTQELITGALREKKSAYPILAVREVVANALIHQDFSVTGTGPVVEIFDNRIEVTNSGTPLVDVRRIIDNPPKSRNEKLAALMRRLKMCEELGTGWDKIVITCELYQLPAPKIELFEDSTRVTLFSEISFSNLSMENKLWACYLHACIKHVQGEQLTNSSLRERFGLENSASATISRLIKEAVAMEIIKPLDPTTAPRYMKYIPVWA